jgi:hypothetical protein
MFKAGYILVAATLITASAAAAEDPTRVRAPDSRMALCASYNDHAGVLAAKFGEHPVFTGQLDEGQIVRIFANGSSGTWTMLVIRKDGTSCVQTAGEGGARDVGN